jgi:hypothetical protein
MSVCLAEYKEEVAYVLKMETAVCSETAVAFYQTTWRHILEDKALIVVRISDLNVTTDVSKSHVRVIAMFTDLFHKRELKTIKVEASVIQEHMYTHIRLINMTARSEF